MFCQYCGAQLQEDASFCPKCGRAVNGKGMAQAAIWDVREKMQSGELKEKALTMVSPYKKIILIVTAVFLFLIVGMAVINAAIKANYRDNGYKKCIEEYLEMKDHDDEIPYLTYEPAEVEGYEMAIRGLTPFYDKYGNEQTRTTRAVYNEETGWEVYDCMITVTTPEFQWN